ncbi:hypothetical protein HRI_004057900 [Hibiscus trionum]|uniref:Uncharacterized protein n=1 Tax=Hibiscus trionum TaxID=183268 RepID=A0A9W7IZF9_HIBTR|nr:hypothetical protein HRI_004057900 [Hibiscus trionum]
MAATATATTTQTQPPNPLLKAPKGPSRSKHVGLPFATYSKTIIDHLKSLHIPIFPGLTDQEFSSIESTFNFTFPPDLRSILRQGLPVHPSFPNWRSSSPQQLHIFLNLPLLSLSNNIRFNHFWSDSWGPKPSNSNAALALVKKLLRTSPTLVPIYRNCYIPSTPNVHGNPVFYVDGEEVRIMSVDIDMFFQQLRALETGGVFNISMMKKSNSVDTAARRIQFWTEVAERGNRAAVARGFTVGAWWNRAGVEERESRLGACLEEGFCRLREGGWTEEDVRDMMMIDGCDHNDTGTQLVMDREDAAWHVRVLSVVLLRAGWTRKDVVYSLDLHDVIDKDDDKGMNCRNHSGR